MREKDFGRTLAGWFAAHRRDLPWRQTRDAYTIWISEIILQQTRVCQGRGYFERFVARFPDVRTLAAADEDEVLRLWQGLGYYSRARNLHAAARQIAGQFGGKFPETYSDILRLKGVGEYTAAAVASFAYGLPHAVVDGNVYRLLARFFGIETPIDTPRAKRDFAELAQTLLDKKNPALHNQAIMEFGALQCVPANPDCAACPLNEGCRALAEGKVDTLPTKSAKKASRNRFFNYFYIQNGGKTYIKKRTGKDIWRNLYEFPLVETEHETSLEDLLQNDFFRKFPTDGISIAGPLKIKHILSHQNIFAAFYTVALRKAADGILPEFTEVAECDIDAFPISRLSEIFLEKKGGSILPENQ